MHCAAHSKDVLQELCCKSCCHFEADDHLSSIHLPTPTHFYPYILPKASKALKGLDPKCQNQVEPKMQEEEWASRW